MSTTRRGSFDYRPVGSEIPSQALFQEGALVSLIWKRLLFPQDTEPQRSLNRSKSGPSPWTKLPWETITGAVAPDNTALRVIGALNHQHSRMAILRGDIH